MNEVDHSDKINEAELLEWVYGTELPTWFNAPTSTSLDKVINTQKQWLTGTETEELTIEGWSVVTCHKGFDHVHFGSMDT